MNINKPFILSLLCILAISTCLITACGTSNTESAKTSLDSDAICKEIIEAGAFADTLNIIDSSYSDMTIGINTDSFTNAVIYTGSGATAEELSIIQVAEAKNTDYIISKLQTHIANQANAYGGYKPEEVDKINNAIIKKTDCYVILCVASDNAKALDIIDKYFK